ncbi:MAG TPA: TetR/AcrR family transcriptional regulator, partial [Ktedonobacterales bacterium]|nr:TetR/AcrR family transcriptional regulator [Ktedonobacterales bacterium]
MNEYSSPDESGQSEKQDTQAAQSHTHAHTHTHTHSQGLVHTHSHDLTHDPTHDHESENGKISNRWKSAPALTSAPEHTYTPRGGAQRRALTVAAYHLIAEKGFEHFRTRDVAQRVGVNIATLHYYFPSKEDLIRSVVDYLADQFATRNEPYANTQSEPLAEVRRELTDTLYQRRF